MKKNYIWIVAAVAAFGFYLYSRMNFAKSLIFRLTDIKPDGNLKNPHLIISINVTNPSNQTANIKSIAGTLYMDDKSIAVINTSTTQIIEPQTDSILKVIAKPQIIGIALLIKDLLYKSKRSKINARDYKFEGNINVDGVLLPINESIKL
jgi:LEA14-like dessication related protein